MKAKYLFYICAGVFCLALSCSKVAEEKNHQVLHVSLKETKTSLFDLFDKVELIPLETNNESLIKVIDKVRFYDNKYYVLDQQLAALFIFGENGKYIDKIHRIGNGPGEYNLIYDFYLNQESNTIDMMSPTLIIYTYDIENLEFITENNFLDSYDKLRNIQEMEYWSKDSYIFYSYVRSIGKSLNIISKSKGDITMSLFNEKYPVVEGFCQKVFNRDNKNNLYGGVINYQDGLLPYVPVL
jgi:hypothetical protein